MFINISYNGITFSLQVQGGIVYGAPEAIRSELQALFDTGNYVEIPQAGELSPDWNGLTTALEPYFNIGLAANYVVFTQCFNMLLVLQASSIFDLNEPSWRNFVYNLNLGKDAFSSAQITEIEAIFAAKNVPFIFNS